MGTEAETWHLAGRHVAVARLDVPFWPEDGFTKGDMLRYYRDVAPALLPYCHDRPVTTRAFPEGIHGRSYYRRDLPEAAPPWLRRADYRAISNDRVIQLPLLDDAAGLLWLANQGDIEFHLWGARFPALEQPDLAILDLDPGAEATFADALGAALLVREALARRDLRGYPKTSGGRGVHIYLPLAPGHTFARVRAWVRALAEELAAAAPDRVALAHGATHRGRLITIDYAQNSIGRNTAAPYTLRARAGVPVSTPLSWEEVEVGRVQPEDFTPRVVLDRLQRLGDLFAPVLHEGQQLPPG